MAAAPRAGRAILVACWLLGACTEGALGYAQHSSLTAVRSLRRGVVSRKRRSDPVVVRSVRRGNEGVYCCPSSPLAARVLRECTTLRRESFYRAPMGWGWNGHAHTILASVLRATPSVYYARELLETPDGGRLALDVLTRRGDDRAAKGSSRAVLPSPRAFDAPNTRPFLLLQAGLGGGSAETYIRSMAVSAAEAGFHVAVLNMRGCAGSPVTSPRFFSAHRGSTCDLRLAVAHARSSAHLARDAPSVTAVGFSNGASVLVNALAEQETTHAACALERIDAAVALACPLNMPAADQSLSRAFNKALYASTITANLLASFRAAGADELFARAQAGGRPIEAWDGVPMSVDVERLMRSRTVREVDEVLTSKSFGYSSVEEYYRQSSADQRLSHVRVPLLLVNAADDPLVPAHSLPFEAVRRSEHVMLALTAHGGHLGWCCREQPFGRASWIEETACSFLAVALRQRAAVGRRAARLQAAGSPGLGAAALRN